MKMNDGELFDAGYRVIAYSVKDRECYWTYSAIKRKTKDLYSIWGYFARMNIEWIDRRYTDDDTGVEG